MNDIIFLPICMLFTNSKGASIVKYERPLLYIERYRQGVSDIITGKDAEFKYHEHARDILFTDANKPRF